MQFPHQIYKRAGLNSTDLANLFGVSRITGYRWLLGVNRRGEPGVGVHVFLRKKVAEVTSKVNAALEAGLLPNHEIRKLPPEVRADKLCALLDIER